MAAIRTFQTQALDQTGLQVYQWKVETTKPAVLITHGLGEHALRYEAVAQWLNTLGYTVYAYDLRGHGASMGKRAVLPSAADLDSNGFVHDLVGIFDVVVQQTGQAPIVLGHSLGGLITARFVTSELRSPAYCILTSPALGLRMSGIQKTLLKYLPKFAPNLAIPNGLNVKLLSHDKAIVAAYKADPMVHGVVTPRLVQWMVTAIAAVQSKANDLKIPTLLLYASEDGLVDPAGSALFASQAKSGMVQAHEMTGAYHEILNETPQWREPSLSYIHKALQAI